MLKVKPKRPRRRKLLFRVLWSLFAIVVGVCLFWTYSYYTALWERDALIAELRAKGEPVWWDEVADKLLAEPTEGTGADLYLRAIWALGGETNPKGPCVPSKQLTDELERDKFNPRVHPLVEQELKLAIPALTILEESVRLPPGRVIKALRTEDPCSIILSQVQDMRRVQRILHWQSFDAVAKSDSNRAYHAAWLALAGTQQLANDPFAISQLVRLIVMSHAIDQLMMCLCWLSPPELEFAAIDRLLAGWEVAFDLESLVGAERGMWLTTLERPNIFWVVTSRTQRKPQGIERTLDGWLLDVASSQLGRPLRLRAQVEYLKWSPRLTTALDRPQTDPNAFDRETEVVENASTLNRITGETGGSGVKWLAALQRRCSINHQKITLARLALRLRRHFDQYGRLPEKLDELCDESMPKIRLEWFLNQAIVYKPSAKGFRLETPEGILSSEDRKKLSEKPINSEVGLEIEFKTVKQGSFK
jgi:hypothetical protein